MKKVVILVLLLCTPAFFTACNSAPPETPSADDAAAETAAAEPASTLVEVPYPANGYVFYGDSDDCICPLKIVTQGEDAFYIKLISDFSGDIVLAFFIQPGQSVDLYVPPGTYQVKYACGTAWYGDSELFGPDTTYYLADDIFKFTEDADYIYGYTLKLYEQPGGNLEKVEIDAASF